VKALGILSLFINNQLIKPQTIKLSKYTNGTSRIGNLLLVVGLEINQPAFYDP
jgi:hypothetical protein